MIALFAWDFDPGIVSTASNGSRREATDSVFDVTGVVGEEA